MILIIDDEYDFAENLKKELEKYYTENEKIEILTGFDTIFLANNNIETLFLDIELGSQNGIDLAVEYYRYNQCDNAPDIVFVSSHDNYVHHSFVAMPLYFIRKEKLIPDLKECMQLLKKIKSERKMEVTIQNERIKLANVLYIESNKNNVYYVFLNRKKLKMRTTLRKIEKELINYNFIRCHASFVVNMSQIRKVTSDFIFLDKDEKIPIGEKYYMNFLDKYADYKFRKK